MQEQKSFVVYVVGTQDGHQKIGFSANLAQRLKFLGVECGQKLEVAASFSLPGDEAKKVERYAHHLLFPHRIRGQEWFNVTPEAAVLAVNQAIDEVRQGKPIPMLHPVGGWGARPVSDRGLPRTTTSLIESRRAAGLTQTALAEMLGVSLGYVGDIEHGRRELPEKYYDKLPSPIREAVIKATKAELRERIKRLDRIGKDC